MHTRHHAEDNCIHTAYWNEQNYIWQVYNSRNSFSLSTDTMSWTMSFSKFPSELIHFANYFSPSYLITGLITYFSEIHVWNGPVVYMALGLYKLPS